MKELLDASQVMQIADNNPNLIPTTVVILAVVYIVYAIVSIQYNKKRLKQLQKIKRKIQIRHESIVTENERRRRFAEKNNSNSNLSV